MHATKIPGKLNNETRRKLFLPFNKWIHELRIINQGPMIGGFMVFIVPAMENRIEMKIGTEGSKNTSKSQIIDK